MTHSTMVRGGIHKAHANSLNTTRDLLRLKSKYTPAASSKYATLLPETARLPCLATWAAAAETTKAAAVETLKIFICFRRRYRKLSTKCSPEMSTGWPTRVKPVPHNNFINAFTFIRKATKKKPPKPAISCTVGHNLTHNRTGISRPVLEVQRTDC